MRDFYFESVLLWTENICVPVNRVWSVPAWFLLNVMKWFTVHLLMKGTSSYGVSKVCYRGETKFCYHEILRKFSRYLRKKEKNIWLHGRLGLP